jgi:hypothetical protein
LFSAFIELVPRLQNYAEMKSGISMFGITRQGLIALTLSVGALWACVGMEAATRQQTNRDTVASLRKLARLRRLSEGQNMSSPTRAPIPGFRRVRPCTS